MEGGCNNRLPDALLRLLIGNKPGGKRQRLLPGHLIRPNNVQPLPQEPVLDRVLLSDLEANEVGTHAGTNAVEIASVVFTPDGAVVADDTAGPQTKGGPCFGTNFKRPRRRCRRSHDGGKRGHASTGSSTRRDDRTDQRAPRSPAGDADYHQIESKDNCHPGVRESHAGDHVELDRVRATNGMIATLVLPNFVSENNGIADALRPPQQRRQTSSADTP